LLDERRMLIGEFRKLFGHRCEVGSYRVLCSERSDDCLLGQVWRVLQFSALPPFRWTTKSRFAQR